MAHNSKGKRQVEVDRPPAAFVRSLHASLVLRTLHFINLTSFCFETYENRCFRADFLFCFFSRLNLSCHSSTIWSWGNCHSLSMGSALAHDCVWNCPIQFPHTHLLPVFALTTPLALCLSADLAPSFTLTFFPRTASHSCLSIAHHPP